MNAETDFGAETLVLSGWVQAVGMRPTVYRFAQKLGLAGHVFNRGDEVVVQVHGKRSRRDELVNLLERNAPPLARIRQISRHDLPSETEVPKDFSILPSENKGARRDVRPDASICSACRQEVLDPRNRRFGHPFISCIHCGPRFSIIETLPFDRANTCMKRFELCESCRSEFSSPEGRRFHTQTIACPDCGPKLRLHERDSTSHGNPTEIIARAAQALAEGKVVALKGIGGFHLAVDACNEVAVSLLRRRKYRPDKPFALMASSVEVIGRYAEVSVAEENQLRSPAAPIVLLGRLPDGPAIAEAVAPGQHRLGFMLPHSPLHLLLLEAFARIHAGPLVMTSGNASDAPPCIDNTEALSRLGQVADVFVLHDRPILRQLDDSVVTNVAGHPRFVRRARGFAPANIALPRLEFSSTVFAAGAQLKSCFGFASNGTATLSQHLGDLQEAGVLDRYASAVADYRQMMDTPLAVIAVDKHPNYSSTRMGRQLAAETGARLIEVQHHHAHAAACLADNQVSADHPPIVSVVLDGSGMGDDETIWGGELLSANYSDCQRLGHIRRFALPGGETAIKEPWRCALSLLHASGAIASDAHWEALFGGKRWQTLLGMLKKNINSPLTSSTGRLFDAVAAMLGLHADRISYEGQAAIALENCADPNAVGAYDFRLEQNADGLIELDWAPVIFEIFRDLQEVDRSVISMRFHRGFAAAIVGWVRPQLDQIPKVALSGGAFQNRLLFGLVSEAFESLGIEVLSHRQVPCNDGGIALGQLAVASVQAASNPQEA